MRQILCIISHSLLITPLGYFYIDLAKGQHLQHFCIFLVGVNNLDITSIQLVSRAAVFLVLNTTPPGNKSIHTMPSATGSTIFVFAAACFWEPALAEAPGLSDAIAILAFWTMVIPRTKPCIVCLAACHAAALFLLGMFVNRSGGRLSRRNHRKKPRL